MYAGRGIYAEALQNYFLALKISEQSGEKKARATTYNKIGNIYSSQGNRSEALKNHLLAKKIREATRDKKGLA